MTARIGRYAIVLTGVFAALWLTGLIFFVAAVENWGATQIGPDLAITDAIVVLTGGSERVTTGLELLEAHKAKKLFISGVHPGLTLDRLLAHQQISPDLRACCIILGHEAESTVGNAEETLTWMGLENYHSLRLVTANYHMPRSLMVFRALMPPDMQIIPHPITPDSVKLEDWWQRPGTASLLVTEYDKYLLADLRLWLR